MVSVIPYRIELSVADDDDASLIYKHHRLADFFYCYFRAEESF